MFGSRKPRRIEETTTMQLWFGLIFGTLIAGGMLAGSFFSKEPEWFLWMIPGFCAFWLVGWWRKIFAWFKALAEFQGRK